MAGDPEKINASEDEVVAMVKERLENLTSRYERLKHSKLSLLEEVSDVESQIVSHRERIVALEAWLDSHTVAEASDDEKEK